MKAVLDYIKGILADGKGVPSSKRVISIIFALLIGIAFVANLGWNLDVDDNILDAVMLIVIAGLGITGIEKFAPKAKKNEDPEA
jgi:hypothetical protein